MSYRLRHNVVTRMQAPVHLPDTNGWKDRHNSAVLAPTELEAPIVDMLIGWALYAERHLARCESVIADDGVLGPAWQEIADGIITLLNGETGRLDCGTLDRFIRRTLVTNGAAADESAAGD